MFHKIVKFFQGRSTLFAVFFALTGFVLSWFNKLNPSYVALVSALQGYVVVHSIKEDYQERNCPPKDGN